VRASSVDATGPAMLALLVLTIGSDKVDGVLARL
jgi:hypothetical protein